MHNKTSVFCSDTQRMAPRSNSVHDGLRGGPFSQECVCLPSHHAARACRWLHEHPVHSTSVQDMDAAAPGRPLQLAQAAFTRASEATPGDADILTALGVIMHLASDYHGAATAFEAALEHRPDDYSLWNKLGATLANSARSEQAKAAYVQALRVKPNYMRAWTNMGISHANLGQYHDAARFYLRALRLNRGAQGVWTHLETALVLQGRADLLPRLEGQDVEGIAAEIGVD